MNISSSSSSSCIFKEVHAHLPDETAVAVALRKKMEREGDTKDYGITDQPTITVTIRGADSDSDTDAPTIPWGISDDDNEFSPMNPELAEDDEIAIARTILKSFHIDKSKVSLLLPNSFIERKVRVFSKNRDPVYVEAVAKAFENYQRRMYKQELQLTPMRKRARSSQDER